MPEENRLTVKVLGCYGSRMPGHQTSSLLVNGRLLLDSGTATSLLPLEQQLAIDDILLTHAHLDHIVDLAFLADNVMTLRKTPLRVWGPEQVLEAVQEHLFNDRIWPDFTRLPGPDGPAVELAPLAAGRDARIGGVAVRWVQTNHPVFAAGYCLSQGESAVLFSGDTGVTEELWAMGRCCPGLAAAFVETTFPDRLEGLAHASGHLTPALLAAELRKLDRGSLPIKILHMKPQFLDEILGELSALGEDRLQVLRGGEEFSF
ncbi:cAMP phosphodiesterase class-II:metallo-beta-lactamase superfamily protein [Desulfuromonas versatilis]|uniref:cAMP phosphodiesterase class-II:metallo-beta-lactamase superfamily protein n=1 Tax=Desulfuromonas versatilis TaxID=2802975 RepID=A0ABM8HN52_9BACT|nr:3',5'-cyclic-nucleotide phosphodiesterase [Desulfuromonas versatilis]BCR04081.1 cAMP phosphodiesterase class-II:metallo-beta-lactamase superfamily protein [Desulfuromonas versatilis]